MSNEIQPTQRRRKRIDPRAVLGILAGLYTVSPVDAIPDVIPVLGQADDATVILFAVVIILFLSVMGGE